MVCSWWGVWGWGCWRARVLRVCIWVDAQVWGGGWGEGAAAPLPACPLAPCIPTRACPCFQRLVMLRLYCDGGFSWKSTYLAWLPPASCSRAGRDSGGTQPQAAGDGAQVEAAEDGGRRRLSRRLPPGCPHPAAPLASCPCVGCKALTLPAHLCLLPACCSCSCSCAKFPMLRSPAAHPVLPSLTFLTSDSTCLSCVQRREQLMRMGTRATLATQLPTPAKCLPVWHVQTQPDTCDAKCREGRGHQVAPFARPLPEQTPFLETSVTACCRCRQAPAPRPAALSTCAARAAQLGALAALPAAPPWQAACRCPGPGLCRMPGPAPALRAPRT